MQVRKAVIPAAGLGTRFLPATKAQPKEMLPIVDKPTIQFIVEEAVQSGITDILIISSRGKKAIEDHFDCSYELESELEKKGKTDLLSLTQAISNMVNIQYVRQKEQRGLGHAIYCAKTFVGDEPFAVLLGDDVVDSRVPVVKQLMDVYEAYGNSVVGVQQVGMENVHKYGIISAHPIKSNLYKANDLIEKPNKESAPSDMAILGRYILTPNIFKHLEGLSGGKDAEIQLTDALKSLANEEDILACVFEGRRFDVGDKMGFLEATVEFALKREDLKKPFSQYLSGIVHRLGFNPENDEESK